MTHNENDYQSQRLMGLLEENAALRAENSELRSEVERLRKEYCAMQCDELFHHLLQGQFQDAETIAADFKKAGITFPNADYMLMSFRMVRIPWEAKESNSRGYRDFSAQMEALIATQLGKEYACFVTHTDSGAYAILAIDTMGEAPPERPRGPHEPPQPVLGKARSVPDEGKNFIIETNKQALALYDLIREKMGVEVFVAISRPFHGIEGIPKAYMDVKEINEYWRIVDIDVPALCYHDFEMADEVQRNINILELEKEYLRKIELGNYMGARQTMHDLLSNDAEYSLDSLRTIKLRTSAKLHALLIPLEHFQNAELYEEVLERIHMIESASLTMGQLKLLVDEIFDKIDQHVWECSQGKLPDWMASMLAYVSENHKNPELNVAMLSDVFQMNPSYLSREVKKTTGYSMLDYIQLLRLQTARGLLSRGTSIQSTAENSGFGDVRSMCRAFQKYLNANPSQYESIKGAEGSPYERVISDTDRSAIQGP